MELKIKTINMVGINVHTTRLL